MERMHSFVEAAGAAIGYGGNPFSTPVGEKVLLGRKIFAHVIAIFILDPKLDTRVYLQSHKSLVICTRALTYLIIFIHGKWMTSAVP